MFLFHVFVPIYKIIYFPFNMPGIFLFLLGVTISLRGSGKFEQKGTTSMTFDKPSVLVTEGIYEYSRNPMYLGLLLALIGVSWSLGSISTIFPVVFYALMLDRYYIPFEENMLYNEFGERYSDYKGRVRRWI